jgi:CRISPR-associated protein Csm1
MSNGVPTLLETTLGAFLHDVGKFWQRAAGSQRHAAPEVRDIAQQALPQRDGRLTHLHALWTWQFFHWLEQERLLLPGVNQDRVRNIAGYHHRPGGGPPEEAGVQHLVAEADQLAAGMDRATRQDEESDTPAGWDAFIRTAMRSPFSSVYLDKELGNVSPTWIPLVQLSGSANIQAKQDIDTSTYQALYQHLLEDFQAEFRAITSLPKPWLFLSSLKSLCERYWHAVPSSTRDQPDVSLYDHSRAVAAIAAAMYQWHKTHDDLSQQSLQGTKSEQKFVWIIGDLSGIQAALFRLQHQQVRGVARILRARSFLMSLITESAALDLLWRLGLTPFSLIQNAGGRFLILAANTPHTKDTFEATRNDVERWMLARWRGELALHLSMTEPFSGELFQRNSFSKMSLLWSAATESAKQTPFSTCYEAVIRDDNFQFGPCPACGVRPALRAQEEGGEPTYCGPCEQERTFGGDLPHLRVIGWSRRPVGDLKRNLELWDGIHIHWHITRANLAALDEGFIVGETFHPELPLALRFLPHYVPVLAADEVDRRAYVRHLSQDARQTQPGDTKTFEHLALDALEEVDGQLYGEDLLAVIKADVDRLGAIFSQGVQRPSLGLVAALSRMLDFFFSARLPYLLKTDERFQSTYVVYAGGDDLLLIGPWWQSLELLKELQAAFANYVGNPHITLSAGLTLVDPDEPLNRSVRDAEERLERAKHGGRNRVCAIDPAPLGWADFARQLEAGEVLLRWMRSGALSQAFVYRMLAFDRDRMACQNGTADAHSASWRARWGYQLRRNLKDHELGTSPLVQFLNRLLGLDPHFRIGSKPPSARTAITMAVYRNRSF